MAEADFAEYVAFEDFRAGMPAGRFHLVPFALQIRDSHRTDAGVVVDDQDPEREQGVAIRRAGRGRLPSAPASRPPLTVRNGALSTCSQRKSSSGLDTVRRIAYRGWLRSWIPPALIWWSAVPALPRLRGGV